MLDGGLIPERWTTASYSFLNAGRWTAASFYSECLEDRSLIHDKILVEPKPMLVDFSDGIKPGGEPKPIMVDLRDEKKQPWMFTLDGGLIPWAAASFLERRPP